MKWRELMKSLGFKYDIHDCRHSFCRRIVQKYDAKAAMEFAGHRSIVTTNQYLQSKTAWSEERLLYDVSNI
jgi:integrase